MNWLANLPGNYTRTCASKNAETDALHLGVASYYQIDFLLTWNMKHLANARIRREIERFQRDKGEIPPIICTPEELAGWGDDYD